MSQSLGRLNEPEADLFPSGSVTHCDPKELFCLYTSGFPKRPASLLGTDTPSAGRRAKVGQTGPLSHTARVSASIFCSPCKLSESWGWATLCRMAISGPPPYRLFRYTQVSSEICP